MVSPMPCPIRTSTRHSLPREGRERPPGCAAARPFLQEFNLMAKKFSAGILLYRRRQGVLEVLLIHPGGPFWARRDEHSWSIPKGEYLPAEDPLDAAKREFREETGHELIGDFKALRPVKQASGKLISAWAVAGDFDPAELRSNTFQIEWPPRSGERRDFPEVDRAGWFDLEAARRKIVPGQIPLLDELGASVAPTPKGCA
jgi:predicted NUDIX family NTP pyrophosphohydrolase